MDNMRRDQNTIFCVLTCVVRLYFLDVSKEPTISIFKIIEFVLRKKLM
jgi:hypothetical protein